MATYNNRLFTKINVWIPQIVNYVPLYYTQYNFLKKKNNYKNYQKIYLYTVFNDLEKGLGRLMKFTEKNLGLATKAFNREV